MARIGTGDLLSTEPMYPLHQNSVLEMSGLAGLGACYNWTQPCSEPTDPCGSQSSSVEPAAACATTVGWFWIGAAAIVLFGLARRR